MNEQSMPVDRPRAPAWRLALETRWGIFTARVALIAMILALWEFVPAKRTEFFISKPSLIFQTLADWMTSGSLWPHLGATLTAMAVGYVLGCVIGVLGGLTLGFLPRVYRVLAPFITAAFALPKIALAPLFIIFFGLGLAPKIAIVTVTVGFLVFQSTMDGVRNIDNDYRDAFLVMGASRTEIMVKLLIPAARPWIFSGMRLAVRYAFTNTLLAELFSANSGIGYLIEAYSARFDLRGAYAAISVMVILSVVLTELLTRIENRSQRRGN